MLSIVCALAAIAALVPNASASTGTGTLGVAAFSPNHLARRGLTGSNSGEMTYYDVGLGACEATNSNTELVVALNSPDFGPAWPARSSAACRTCVRITSPQNPSAAPLVAKIVDKCPGCKAGDIDGSPAVFTHFFPEGKGRFTINWTAVACDGSSGNLPPAPAPAPKPPAPKPKPVAPPVVVVVPTPAPKPATPAPVTPAPQQHPPVRHLAPKPPVATPAAAAAAAVAPVPSPVNPLTTDTSTSAHIVEAAGSRQQPAGSDAPAHSVHQAAAGRRRRCHKRIAHPYA
ncbi:RlpA-like double-psi beta-barrel-protein domain-containing protein-containing protein [Blastocladiella britannica]|nr:RlpA-like double-psi beta-barrel-protein domain-containing protein-containing protein [Blastocladiella britannica]